MTSSSQTTTSSSNTDSTYKLGTFKGVFLPNMLQMMGVILFLKLGSILGHVGLGMMTMIIIFASGILLLTSLSMTAIVSNMKVGGGGAYYILSRMLGLEFGGAIGILLCLSQLAALVMNISGLSLSLYTFFPTIPFSYIQIGTLTTLVLISYSSTSFALRAQAIVLCIVVVAISTIFIGQVPSSMPSLAFEGTTLRFWTGFALFFPAITGIEVGMAMSGDLKSPNRSLPIGTLAAVLLAFALYLSISIFLFSRVSQEQLVTHPFILKEISRFGGCILLGLWGSALSNSLSGLLGTPRVMQALAKDRVLPSFLQKGSGPTNQPRIAILAVFCLALALALLTNIDQVIPLMTMVCLATYGMINFVAFVESFINNPSWRPTFSIHWVISLVGCLSCFITMLLINPIAAFCIFTLMLLLCLWTSGRKLKNNWDDIRHSIYAFIAQKATAKLASLGPNPKSWRPNILTVFDAAGLEKELALFSHSLDQGMGFLTFGTHVPKGNQALCSEETIQELLDTHQIPAYIHINRLREDVKQMIENYGFGPLKPNTIILSLNKIHTQFDAFSILLRDIQKYKKNIVLFKAKNGAFDTDRATEKNINLWWRGGNQKNFELCLALSYLMTTHPSWSGSTICIKSIVAGVDRQKKLEHVFRRYKKRLRIKNLTFETIIDPNEAFFPNLLTHSTMADFTFLGLRTCQPGESLPEYQKYLTTMIEKTTSLPQLALTIAGENLDFEKILN